MDRASLFLAELDLSREESLYGHVSRLLIRAKEKPAIKSAMVLIVAGKWDLKNLPEAGTLASNNVAARHHREAEGNEQDGTRNKVVEEMGWRSALIVEGVVGRREKAQHALLVGKIFDYRKAQGYTPDGGRQAKPQDGGVLGG